jgi:hypothetical protein
MPTEAYALCPVVPHLSENRYRNRPGAIDVLALPTIVFLVECRSKLMLYKRDIAVNRQTNRDFLCFFSCSAVPQILVWR